MPVFQIMNGKAQQLDVSEFRIERELQKFFENNLETLLGIHLIHSEYEINSESGRIDTLGIDESRRPVIIEYKLEIAEDKVLAQGLAYKKWLNRNKKLFNLLAKEKYQIEVNWELTRLVFIAKSFAKKMRDAVQDDEDVDLFQYTLFQNSLIVLDNVSRPSDNRKRKSAVPKVGQTVPQDIERYLSGTKQELHEPFFQLRAKLLDLPEIKERVQPKTGVSYYVIKAIARFEFGKSYINLILKTGASNADIDHRLRDITSNDWGFPFLFKINTPEDIEYAFNLIQAAYQAAL